MQARRRVWTQRLLHRFVLDSLALFGSVHASAALASIADAGASDNRPDLQQDAGMVAMSGGSAGGLGWARKRGGFSLDDGRKASLGRTGGPCH
jgi:hypothetical protein